MASISINQAVDVRSYPPTARRPDGSFEGEVHIHSFNNLVPACEFAVSLASEGHLDIQLVTEAGDELDLEQAQKIVAVWESGAVSLDAEDLDY